MFQKNSPLTIKADRDGSVSGLAWSFAHAPDLQGDHILASAFRHGSNIPMLLEHKHQVGDWHDVSVDDDGLRVSGQIDKSTRLGREVVAKAADGQLSGLSIGFAGEFQRSGSNRIFVSADLAEVSIVAKPANVGARVTAIKSLNECSRISDFQRTLKQQLGITKRQAQLVARELWPLWQEQPEEQEQLLTTLNNFSLR